MNETGDTTVSGPLSNGNYLLQDVDGLCFATVKNDLTNGAASRRVALVLSRAFKTLQLLEQVGAALEADDDGTRWKPELDAIHAELAIYGQRIIAKPLSAPPPEPLPPPRPSLTERIELIRLQAKERNDQPTQSQVRVPHVQADTDPFADDSGEVPTE